MSLRAARSVTPGSKPDLCTHDVFVSHAHADSKIAHAVADWLKLIWPEARLYLSQPGDEKTFLEDPGYFLRELQASKCILYLLTPNNFGRPMVSQEVAGSVNKPIVTFMVGVTSSELRGKLKNNLFFALDYGKIVDIAEKGA